LFSLITNHHHFAMVQESATPTTAPSGRPKRAAASKAEHVFRTLALADAVQSNGQQQQEQQQQEQQQQQPSKSNKAPAGEEVSAPQQGEGGEGTELESVIVGTATTGAGVTPDYEAAGGGSDSAAAGGGEGHSGGGGASHRPQQTKRRNPSSRGAKKRGKLKQETASVRPLKSEQTARSGSGSGIGGRGQQPSMKPRPVATEASIAKVLDRLAGWGVKVRVPAHPTLDDVWRGTDTVLRNLPDTSVLTLDALVGHSRLRRYAKKWPPPPPPTTTTTAGGGCSAGAAATLSGGGCGSSHHYQRAARDRGGYCSTSQQHRVASSTSKKQGWKAGQQPPRGAGEGEDGVGSGGGAEDEAAAAAATGEGAKMVEDELGDCDDELQQVELALASTLQRIATTVEEFRYDEDSPEEARRIAFREKTLRAYEPLEERERQAKAEFAARMNKLNQVELKRKKEEDIAVCYVCNSGDHVEKQEDIVFCERCCVAVHMSCYNAEE
ncbi:unnamed protein product, partial [Ectocarpus fasciculatus]